MQKAKRPNINAILRHIEVPVCEAVIVCIVVVTSQKY